ncbi:hypothetical protein ACLOJK_009892 [Asimina triloba]
MRLNPKQTGKSESLTPWQMATDVVSAVHNAECDDGIPPELNRILRSHFLSKKKFKNTFIVCARAQASSPETNVGFAASVAMNGLICTLAAAVVVLSSAMPTPPLCKTSTSNSEGPPGRGFHFRREARFLMDWNGGGAGVGGCGVQLLQDLRELELGAEEVDFLKLVKKLGREGFLGLGGVEKEAKTEIAVALRASMKAREGGGGLQQHFRERRVISVVEGELPAAAAAEARRDGRRWKGRGWVK